jgi:hypothetical protein
MHHNQKMLRRKRALPHYFFTHGTNLYMRDITRRHDCCREIDWATDCALLQCDQTNLETGGLDLWSGYVEHAVDDYVWRHAFCHSRMPKILLWQKRPACSDFAITCG